MVYKFCNKKSKRSSVNIETEPNEKSAKESSKPIVINFQKRTAYSGFKDNIWGTDFADIQLISKFDKGFRLSLCVIDILSKYAWVVPLKNKKDVSIAAAFQKIFDDLNRKPNKIWVDKGSQFYNSSFKK